jgi:hypothetical protein
LLISRSGRRGRGRLRRSGRLRLLHGLSLRARGPGHGLRPSVLNWLGSRLSCHGLSRLRLLSRRLGGLNVLNNRKTNTILHLKTSKKISKLIEIDFIITTL